MACPGGGVRTRMIFNTWVYGAFLAVTVTLYWLCPPRWRPVALTGFGFFFYWYYFPPHIVLITIATLAVFALGWLVRPDPGRRYRVPFVLGVAGCIGLLAYYKYQGFLAACLDGLLDLAGFRAHLDPPRVRAPLGISFFAFEYVHYLFEIWRGTFTRARLPEFMLFIMFFPTLICGPIKRFGQFRPQEHALRRLEVADLNAGLERIVFGLAKKTLVADAVAPYCAGVFANPAAYGWAQLWIAVYAYAVQIYFDFSGYSDIAIGSARLFGYAVPENFDYPYLQPNIARFWRSWHMSLTSWITDYVYIPLGGNARGELRAYGNRLVSMTLCGLWHGAAFHFAVWGFYHGVALNLYRFYERLRGPRQREPHLAVRALGAVLTFHVVCIGWVLFVCDVPTAWFVIRRLFLLPA